MLVPVILSTIRNLEPHARAARVERNRHEAEQLRKDLIDRLERQRDAPPPDGTSLMQPVADLPVPAHRALVVRQGLRASAGQAQRVAQVRQRMRQRPFGTDPLGHLDRAFVAGRRLGEPAEPLVGVAEVVLEHRDAVLIIDHLA